MSSLFRPAIRPLHFTGRTSLYVPNLISIYSPASRSLQARHYAKRKDKDEDNKPSKSKKGKHTEDEVVHSRNNINDPSLKFVPSSALPYGAEYDVEKRAADEKFQSSLKWLKEQARGVEIRSSGRVVPDVLDGVRVSIESEEGGESSFEVGLKEIATVGVKNGNVLVVTVFEEQNIRQVEKALYLAKLPGLTPQRTDARTILMPVSQPTVESRNQLLANLSKQAEDTRVSIRKVHQAAHKKVKALGFDSKSGAMVDLQTLVNKRIEEIDAILEAAKKAASK